MHVLAAKAGTIEEGKEPIDLAQTPADIVFLSAADSELAALCDAHNAPDSTDSQNKSTLRLANLNHLLHPLSVDMHLDTCAEKSKLVIVRLLGGIGYWEYGVKQYAARLFAAGVPFAVLPGDDKPDETLFELSTIPRQDWQNLWGYLVEGGGQNATHFLDYARAMLGQCDPPPAPAPLLRAGLYWPNAGVCDLAQVQKQWQKNAPIVALTFYRALVQGAGLHPINRMIKSLKSRGLNPLPIFVASLKDPLSVATLDDIFARAKPDVILNTTGFAVGTGQGDLGGGGVSPTNPLNAKTTDGAMVFQVVLSGTSHEQWQDGTAGLPPRDIAMNVALPEVDGRVLSRAISFKDEAYFDEVTQCSIATYRACGDRVDFVADLANHWIRLRHTPAKDKNIAIILANYPNKDGRLANGVGLDTPAALVHVLSLMQTQGYDIKNAPTDSDAMMQLIQSAPTNDIKANDIKSRGTRTSDVRISLKQYAGLYKNLPYEARQQIESRWGAPETDPFIADGDFVLPITRLGKICVCVQPARGYNIDPKDSYHSPDLVPPHNYLAFYLWLRFIEKTHAIIHLGKHGNLEWLPGKATALSQTCWPEICLGAIPNLYPFIVNDPGEGACAKRRTSAVIIDHLTPPLTRAESYGPLRDLEALVDEYYEAAPLDARRADMLKTQIIALSTASDLAQDAGVSGADTDENLAKLDDYLCDLKEAQIRDGLHIFGCSPVGDLRRNLICALVRIARGDGAGGNNSLHRAIAADLSLDFDPLDCVFSQPWQGPRPQILCDVSTDTWRSFGDTVERIEELCCVLLDDVLADKTPPEIGDKTTAVLHQIKTIIAPLVDACGVQESANLMTALNARFIPPAPSGAPTRGRLDVLPTGRNFYSIDSRALPTPTAWALGWKSANLLIERHLQDHGDWPRAMLLTAWGTANMRTGGDDIAQALALMGVRPKWDSANRRVTGFEIIPIGALGRPRVDVTLRISGFFRDAFPAQIDLIDAAARGVMALDEPADMNPAAASARADNSHTATARVFGAKPGAYGAGLQTLIDEGIWQDRADLGRAYIEWGSYAYGVKTEGVQAKQAFETRLEQVEAIVQNQDNREHDILDSDDYYQFEGGASAAVSWLQGNDRPIYHNDHSRPERPLVRTLDEEIGRVIRSRVVNPKWIEGVKRHGYKGAFEMAATLDYLFAFAATTRMVKNHHFDLVEAAFIKDTATRDFIAEHNPAALQEMVARLQEAISRGLWQPKSNSVAGRLERIVKGEL